jgi:hypothetical protein
VLEHPPHGSPADSPAMTRRARRSISRVQAASTGAIRRWGLVETRKELGGYVGALIGRQRERSPENFLRFRGHGELFTPEKHGIPNTCWSPTARGASRLHLQNVLRPRLVDGRVLPAKPNVIRASVHHIPRAASAM